MTKLVEESGYGFLLGDNSRTCRDAGAIFSASCTLQHVSPFFPRVHSQSISHISRRQNPAFVSTAEANEMAGVQRKDPGLDCRISDVQDSPDRIPKV